MSETIEQKCIAKGVKLTDQRRIIAKIMSDSQKIDVYIIMYSFDCTLSCPKLLRAA